MVGAPVVALDPSTAGLPLPTRVADAITADIRRGRLAPGARMPSSRALARSLGVHRNTALAAYRELIAQGWLTTRAGAGTFVAPLSASPPTPRGLPPRPAYAIRPGPGAPVGAVPPPGVLELAGGRPDVRLIPVQAIARAWRRGLRLRGRQLLSYGDPRGLPALRAALGELLAAERGLALRDDQLLVTRGAQQALYLVARALLGPGDRVAVEALGYAPAWAALAATGATLVPIPVDRDGLDVAALARAAADAPIRAVYLTPHHQFPTVATLPAERRLALLALARRAGFAVIEDDYDNEFHFTGRPVLPLAHHDDGGVVVYVGTLSKVVAPGLRLGYVAAHDELIGRLVALRVGIDRQGDLATEHAIAELIADGTLGRHLRAMRRTYAARQAHLVDALSRVDGLRFDVPAGGLALWVHTPDHDVDAWAANARALGLWFDTARRFRFDGTPDRWFRCGFAPLDEAAIDGAIDRLDRSRPPPTPVPEASPIG